MSSIVKMEISSTVILPQQQQLMFTGEDIIDTETETKKK